MVTKTEMANSLGNIDVLNKCNYNISIKLELPIRDRDSPQQISWKSWYSFLRFATHQTACQG